MQQMRNMKCTIIPVITGANGIQKSIHSLHKTTVNITHNTESTAVWNLKPERWASPLVQEKYQGEKGCDKKHDDDDDDSIIIISNERRDTSHRLSILDFLVDNMTLRPKIIRVVRYLPTSYHSNIASYSFICHPENGDWAYTRPQF